MSTELQSLIQRFQNYKPHLLQDFPANSSAVLVCLYQEQREENQTELRVILTKRSSNLSSHPGKNQYLSQPHFFINKRNFHLLESQNV